MPRADTIDADKSKPSPTSKACPAGLNDVDTFLRLVRLNVEERGAAFDEADATYVFAGITRNEPAIVLLFEGNEPIGFALLRLIRPPFTSERVAKEEFIYIVQDRRSLDAELMLHAASHAVFDGWSPSAREISISAGPHAPEIATRLAASGYQPAIVTARQNAAPFENAEQRTLN